MRLVGIVVLTSCIFFGLSNLVQAEVMDKEPTALWNRARATLSGISAIGAWYWRLWAGVPVTLLGFLGLGVIHLELRDPFVGSAIQIEAGVSYVTHFYAGGMIWLILNTIGVFVWINKRRTQRYLNG
jgi:hypothetical protein